MNDVSTMALSMLRGFLFGMKTEESLALGLRAILGVAG